MSQHLPPPLNAEDYEKKIKVLEEKLATALKIIQDVSHQKEKEETYNLSCLETEEKRALLGLVDFINNLSNRQKEPYYEFIQLLINKMPYPVFIKDDKGKYLFVNKKEAELFGLKESEIIGKTDEDFVHDTDDLQMIHHTDDEVLNFNKTIELPKQSFRLRNGSSFILQTFKSPLKNPVTGKINVLGYSVDITDSENLSKLKKILVISNNPVF